MGTRAAFEQKIDSRTLNTCSPLKH